MGGCSAGFGDFGQFTPALQPNPPRRMIIAGREPGKRTNPEPESQRTLGRFGRKTGKEQWSAVLGVKPAIEDVNADCFLAFRFAELKTKSSPTTKTHEDCGQGSST